MRDTPHRTITELEDRLRRANEVIESSSPSYTLAEVWELMKQYVAEIDKKSGQYNTMMRLELSAFHEWLARRGEGAGW